MLNKIKTGKQKIVRVILFLVVLCLLLACGLPVENFRKPTETTTTTNTPTATATRTARPTIYKMPGYYVTPRYTATPSVTPTFLPTLDLFSPGMIVTRTMGE